MTIYLVPDEVKYEDVYIHFSLCSIFITNKQIHKRQADTILFGVYDNVHSNKTDVSYNTHALDYSSI